MDDGNRTISATGGDGGRAGTNQLYNFNPFSSRPDRPASLSSQILLYDVHPNASDHAPEALNPRLSAGGVRCVTSHDEWPHSGIATGATANDESGNNSSNCKALSLHGQSWPLPWCSYCEHSITASQDGKVSGWI